jgi:nitrile hydratase
VHSEHEHEHAHDARAEASAAASKRVNALVAELERRSITDDAELAAIVERFLAGAGPHNGARVVARAWADPDFKALLLRDADAAIAELGIDLSHWAPVRLRAVENTAQVHNIVVCTLCSCYPIALLGPSPSWYKSEAYRSRVVREPRAVLREFGVDLSPEVTVNVWDSTAELRYIVIPERPAGTDDFDPTQLGACVSRDALIGVARAVAPG